MHADDFFLPSIPCTTKHERMKENLASVDIVLTGDDLKKTDEAAIKIKIQGARYPESSAKLVGR